MKSYLVEAYRSSTDSLYSQTLFKVIADSLKMSSTEIGIIDLGCADRRSEQIIQKYVTFKYFGVDIDSGFSPHLIADIMDVKICLESSPFKPTVILLTDVLEHLENGEKDIDSFLAKLAHYTPKETKIYITVPQMYRLDSFKLNHLSYPEHKVRFEASEWTKLLSRHLEIVDMTGVSYVTVLPYLLMLFKIYKEDNFLGKTFKKARSFLKGRMTAKIDYELTKKIGKKSGFITLSNAILYECKVKV